MLYISCDYSFNDFQKSVEFSIVMFHKSIKNQQLNIMGIVNKWTSLE